MTGTLVAAVLGAVVLAVLLAAGLGAWRQRVLSRRIGAFECSTRSTGDPAAPWRAGIAHYGAGRVDWWRSWSLSPRPARTWWRAELEVVARSPFVGPGDVDQLVVSCRHLGSAVDLTMSVEAFAGLTAWLEAAPPRNVSRVI